MKPLTLLWIFLYALGCLGQDFCPVKITSNHQMAFRAFQYRGEGKQYKVVVDMENTSKDTLFLLPSNWSLYSLGKSKTGYVPFSAYYGYDENCINLRNDTTYLIDSTTFAYGCLNLLTSLRDINQSCIPIRTLFPHQQFRIHILLDSIILQDTFSYVQLINSFFPKEYAQKVLSLYSTEMQTDSVFLNYPRYMDYSRSYPGYQLYGKILRVFEANCPDSLSFANMDTIILSLSKPIPISRVGW